MQIHRGIEQGSQEWLDMRLGLATASRFKDVMAKGQGKTRASYMTELAAELVTGKVQESYSNAYMDWGTETEPQAIAMYEFETGDEVDRVSFISHDTLGTGCSPDVMVGDKGLAEFKCPKTTTQIDRFLKGKFPTTYKHQVQGQLWISEREWCDFVSFDPRINGPSSYFCIRVERDDKYIKSLEDEVGIFCEELYRMIKILK